MKDIRPNNRLLLEGLSPRIGWNLLKEFAGKR